MSAAPERDDAQAHGELPARVVVGSNGAYWREYPDGYSMCPVSTDNDPVEVVAAYERADDEHSHAFQDEYQRLWHASQARLVADEKALRLCLRAIDLHDEWCDRNPDAPGNSVWWQARDAARAALEARVDSPEQEQISCWVIHLDDASQPFEMFVGEDAEAQARARSEYLGQAWNHVLFRAVDVHGGPR